MIEFGGTVVREVMVPRTDMITVEREVTVEEALEVSSVVGFSRVPVVGENIDDVVGLVYVKDLIRAELDDNAGQTVERLMRHAHFVPETKKVAELLREMQQDKFHMAIVVDEYGGVAGLVTLEDLIEELVGEIVDEYDVEEALVERLVDGSLRVDARILIDELNDLGTLALPEGDWDTVGGLVFDVFGRVPGAGEVCEVDGYRLKVERASGPPYHPGSGDQTAHRRRGGGRVMTNSDTGEDREAPEATDVDEPHRLGEVDGRLPKRIRRRGRPPQCREVHAGQQDPR